jgi:membrane protein YqaA with SNARE-associated domain
VTFSVTLRPQVVSGGALNYLLGYWLYEKTHDRLERTRAGRAALTWGHRYGYAALLLSWLPIIGDPITLVAGTVRLNFGLFLLVAGGLRVLRYLAIVYGVDASMT